ncbi:hypothetical protein SAMN02745751_03342 [Dethiosulfatibacter aminovorans DSM 17477]|uniref:Uncharacterized protein n=1 Tax=Dethiosulfatibacter aminovorans DSM 17477 TaxID=1121476 RepID=A0A1M6M3C5_9FIRM|nr:hypothetical protein [Dethiosulfatibacter aminovorans]SHJ77907.1 hypothetical protein SAMN02745751_03342 [Dethiosulfatibacter aminovorans DSM 17477]
MRICREQSKYGRIGKGNIVKNELKPSTMSYEFGIDFLNGEKSDKFVERIDIMLEHFLEAIESNGCSLIGHIKLILDAGNKGLLMGSVTSFRKKVGWKGSLSQEVGNLTILLNVIVYGIEDEIIDEIVFEMFRFDESIKVSQ